MKNILQRSCIGCGTKNDKKELVRIVKSKNDEIIIDNTGKLPGRGAYICCNPTCLDKIIKSKRLEYAFNTKVPSEVYEKLRGVILEQR